MFCFDVLDSLLPGIENDIVHRYFLPEVSMSFFLSFDPFPASLLPFDLLLRFCFFPFLVPAFGRLMMNLPSFRSPFPQFPVIVFPPLVLASTDYVPAVFSSLACSPYPFAVGR